MNGRKSARYYLIAAIVWTIIAIAALVLLFMAKAELYPTLCGIFLISLCVGIQWLRYRKMK